MPLKNPGPNLTHPTHSPFAGRRQIGQGEDGEGHPVDIIREGLLKPSTRPKHTGPHAEADFDSLNARNGLAHTNDMSRAIGLKFLVPSTIGTEAVSSGEGTPSHKDAHVSEQLPARSEDLPRQKQVSRQSTFDDTTSIDFDDESSLQDNENRTIVYRGPSAPLAETHPHTSTYDDQRRSTFDDTEILDDIVISLGPHWQDDVKAERHIQGQGRQQNTDRLQRDMSTTPVVSHLGQYLKEHDQDLADTPSRARTVTPLRGARSHAAIKTVSFRSPDKKHRQSARQDSPELALPRTKPTIQPTLDTNPVEQAYGGPREKNVLEATKSDPDAARTRFPASLPLQRTQHTSIEASPRLSAFESSRASDYPTSSEDELGPFQAKSSKSEVMLQQDQPLRKRQRPEEIDYDINALKAMKYEDLDKEKFDQSWQGPGQIITPSIKDNERTPSQNLDKLSDMSEAEQRAVFRKQDDDEWAQMGSWFIEKFQEDLKRLMDVRIERRKISMKFEDEIRRRQKDVEWHAAGVEQELSNLKKGGGELIRGKDAAGRRETPQRI